MLRFTPLLLFTKHDMVKKNYLKQVENNTFEDNINCTAFL